MSSTTLVRRAAWCDVDLRGVLSNPVPRRPWWRHRTPRLNSTPTPYGPPTLPRRPGAGALSIDSVSRPSENLCTTAARASRRQSWPFERHQREQREEAAAWGEGASALTKSPKCSTHSSGQSSPHPPPPQRQPCRQSRRPQLHDARKLDQSAQDLAYVALPRRPAGKQRADGDNENRGHQRPSPPEGR